MSEIRGMLARRAANSGCDLASALLDCLDQLAPSTGGEARAALEVAARLICFAAEPGDREEPAFAVDFGATPERPPSPLLEPIVGAPELSAALDHLTRELVFAADVQEYVDARHTSLTYRRAAHAVARAAAALRGSGAPRTSR